MAFPNNLDTDKNVGFTTEKGEVQSISTLDVDDVSDALHQKQSDDLSGDASKVKKFFDYMSLHILIPWINAIVSMVKNNIMPRVEGAENNALTAANAASAAASSASEADKKATTAAGAALAAKEEALQAAGAASAAASSASVVQGMAEKGEFTPKKGVDYYTPQEKADMINEVEETALRYLEEGRELEDQGECHISIGDGVDLGVSHHVKYRVRHSGETITLYSDTNTSVHIALCDEVYSGVLKKGIALILPKDITGQNKFDNLSELRPAENGEVERAWVPGCDVIVGFMEDMPKSCVVSPYIDALFNSIVDGNEVEY